MQLTPSILQPAGQLLAIEDVKDPTFSQKMLGDGYAVEPSDGKVVSPVDGEIMTVFPTKHAIGIKTDDGLEILVHMGLDTVELKGEPFTVNVSEGQKVRHGDLLATADLQAINHSGKGTTMIVIITNMPAVGYMKFDGLARQVGTDEEVVKVILK